MTRKLTRKLTIGFVLKIAVLALLAFVVLYPLSMVVISTLKTERDPQTGSAVPTALPVATM